MEATQHLTQASFSTALPRICAQQQLLTEHSLRTRWCSGSVATTGLFIFASDSKSLSLVIYLPGGFVWVFIQTQPFSFDSQSCGSLFICRNIMLRAMKTLKDPLIPCSNLKPADLMEAQGQQSPRELLCGQEIMLAISKMSLSSTNSTRHLMACEMSIPLYVGQVSRLPAGLKFNLASFYSSSILYFSI